MKRFLLKLSYTVLPLWLAAVGWYVYYNVFLLDSITGDLSRMGQIGFGQKYARYIDSFAPDSFFYEELSSADSIACLHGGVLALGDSYSQYITGSYLNALARRGVPLAAYMISHNFGDFNPIRDARHLLEEGYADSSRVDVMLVETSERKLIPRLLEMETPMPQVPVTQGNAANTSTSPEKRWTLIQPIDYFRKHIGLVASESQVLHAGLRQECFTHERYARDLFFFVEDVKSEMYIDTTQAAHRTAVQNLRRLYQFAEERGVRLVLFVAPDKYDLYQTLVADNPFPPKTVNEDLRRLFPESTKLVLGKELLLPRVVGGERDVYRLDDSHWSYRTADIVAEYLYRLLAPSEDSSSPTGQGPLHQEI